MPSICKKCSTRASFNFITEKNPLYCSTHAEKDMVNINASKNSCKECKKKQPSYGILGQKATHCSSCATDDMIDLVSNLCKFDECRKNATYGLIGEKASRCKKHSTDDMIDVKNKKCIACVSLKVKKPKQPTFGYIKPTHCLEHKEKDMKDLKHSSGKCKECDTRASYGYTKIEYCSKHKKEDMVDLVSKMCVKCKKVQGVFGESKDKLFCKECSEDNMKNIKAKMCEKCNEKQPTYNYPKEKIPRFCASCHLDGMIDIRNPMCKSCGLFMVTKKPHLCSYCNPSTSLRQKTKEMLVVNFLQENDIKFIHNKSSGYVCGNYRPDIKIDANTHMVIVEVDEDQHKQYEQRCENVRMFNIYQAEGLRCVFLRYNPDVYRVNDKAKKIHQETRLKTLLEEVNKHMKTIPDEEVSVYRLYYNSDDNEIVKKIECSID